MLNHISHWACSVYPPCDARDACTAVGQDFSNKLTSVSSWKVIETDGLAVFHCNEYIRFVWHTEKAFQIYNSDGLTKETERKQKGDEFFERFRYDPKA